MVHFQEISAAHQWVTKGARVHQWATVETGTAHQWIVTGDFCMIPLCAPLVAESVSLSQGDGWTAAFASACCTDLSLPVCPEPATILLLLLIPSLAEEDRQCVSQ